MSDRPEQAPNPVGTAQRLARQELPKRFYEQATAEPQDGGFVLKLDGRTARTPGRNPMAVADRAVADALAAEWAAQGERIDPMTMPLTRIVNSAVDRVAGEMAAVRGEIVKYAGTDLVCYRAEEPQGLVEAQEAAWSPVLDWVRETFGARFILAGGIIAVAQPEPAIAAVDAALGDLDPLRLSAVHVAATLTGSALLALALLRKRMTAEAIWQAAHVDEDWQMSQWGRDEIALARRNARWQEMQAAALILSGA
jgi:chaperone required for assembly of F1-ATPase